MLLFNAFCPMLMVSEGFGKSKEIIVYFLRQVTSSNVVTGAQRKRSSQFLTSDIQGMGAGGGCHLPVRFFLNFSKMILHQHLLYAYPLDTFSHKFGENRLLQLRDMTP